MKFENPPHGIRYKLVGTKHYDHDIGLVVMEYGQATKEYFFSKIGQFEDELRSYILDMRDNIIDGKYDLKLLDHELRETEYEDLPSSMVDVRENNIYDFDLAKEVLRDEDDRD